MSEASNERTKISASFLITKYLLNFNGTAQNVTKSDPFRQRSHGGGNCSDDGGAHEGEPALHPTQSAQNKINILQLTIQLLGRNTRYTELCVQPNKFD